MKHSWKVVAIIILMFFVAQLIGIAVINHYSPTNLKSNQEINVILFETDFYDFISKYKILLDFYFSKEISGDYKQREVIKRIRNLFLNSKEIPFMVFFEFRLSSIFKKCKFNLKQKAALYLKIKFSR